MNRREWIRGEIADWQQEGIIGDDIAGKLLGRYADNESRISWGAVLVGGFGALLIGLGIIALFAANWDCFGRGARAAISIAPVAICGMLALVAVKKEWETMAFWEPLGLLWCIATVAATCLVAQTYQVGGSVPGLILFVALLTLPIAWVTRSVVVMAGWPIFAIVWAFASRSDGHASRLLMAESLGLMALSLPALIVFLRRRPGRAALIIGLMATGFVYSFGAGLLACATLPLDQYCYGMESFVCNYWFFAAIVLGVGLACKLPTWPMIATLVASAIAMLTPFERAGLLYFVSFAIAIATAVVGIRKLRLSYTNIGAALFLWLVLVKFFKINVDFITKGILLVVSGSAFVVLNFIMVKFKKRRVK